MGSVRLDRSILDKIADAIGKPHQYVREQISKRAARGGISSEAAQILWAHSIGISTGRFRTSLPPYIQEEVRECLSLSPAERRAPRKMRGEPERDGRTAATTDPVRDAIDHLITDGELKRRCADLLKGRGPYDRVIREATTVLDHRLKQWGAITGYMKPVDVVGKVLNPDPQKALLKFSDEKAEQQGMFNICSGLALAFRGPTHHSLSDEFIRADSLKFCGFIDMLLVLLSQAQRQQSSNT
jgi:hypothetical protein